ASCGCFLGISDSFTAVLWRLDYAQQMAHSNFSGAMCHLGGRMFFIMCVIIACFFLSFEWAVAGVCGVRFGAWL
ncbi:hypothetical protein B0H16DRAFT_1591420, partial [Mycena metata]